MYYTGRAVEDAVSVRGATGMSWAIYRSAQRLGLV